jgi:hypothetical protein
MGWAARLILAALALSIPAAAAGESIRRATLKIDFSSIWLLCMAGSPFAQ